MVPSSFAFLRHGGNVFYHKHLDRKDLTQKRCEPELPLPSGPGRRRQPLLAVLTVLARLAAGRVAIAAVSAHPRRVLLRVLDASAGFGLDIQVGMSG